MGDIRISNLLQGDGFQTPISVPNTSPGLNARAEYVLPVAKTFTGLSMVTHDTLLTGQSLIVKIYKNYLEVASLTINGPSTNPAGFAIFAPITIGAGDKVTCHITSLGMTFQQLNSMSVVLSG